MNNKLLGIWITMHRLKIVHRMDDRIMWYDCLYEKYTNVDVKRELR